MKLYILGIVALFASIFAFGLIGHSWYKTRETEALAINIDDAGSRYERLTTVRERLDAIDDQMVNQGLSEKYPEKYQELKQFQVRVVRLMLKEHPGDSRELFISDIQAWRQDKFYGGYTSFFFVLLSGGVAVGLLIWLFIADPPHNGWRRRYRPGGRTYPRRLLSLNPFR